jgi:hypothetical protein
MLKYNIHARNEDKISYWLTFNSTGTKLHTGMKFLSRANEQCTRYTAQERNCIPIDMKVIENKSQNESHALRWPILR